MTGDRVAVVGACAAGLAAAEALRRHGWRGEVSLIGAEPHLPYDRPPLSKQLLSGAWGPERTRLRGPEQLAELGLDLRLGTTAVSLDARAGRLTLSDGTELECSGVIAATGLVARVLPGSAGVTGVRSLRGLDDALTLREELRTPRRRVVVIGNGVLGSEIAAVIRELGHEVALVGPARTPMEHSLGPCVGALLAQVHTAKGVVLYGGRRVEHLGTAADVVRSVHLDDGTELPADLVLTATGSTPATDWLAGTDGIDLTDGLGCDAYCAAAPNLYAAGDVARWHHPVYGRDLRVEHRMNATEQGIAAARNLLATLLPRPGPTAAEFAPVPYFWTDQYDVRVQAYGLLSPAGHLHTEVFRGDRLGAATLHGADGLATGVVAANLPPRTVRALRAVVARPVPWGKAVDDFKSALDQFETCGPHHRGGGT
ncbi:NAD(P)/FAD-dependent oxidoreductase [Streptomyces lancefieldiae]|uniref:FAD-dependent oxidoreductase n=1 Tax=Streptomyces lancefieldiae TaxID=3075520 RepID=A0ABU3AYV7_9ACTN|nr:FAD-dependent oxidoreductase [Streptomyces sp. DSM 40712]MDT0615367.1 FAD-dependent oxidoreductase [Streptomyces sp. DSM 40712]